jgi:uncharacterized protein YyaL (SSP411 family)
MANELYLETNPYLKQHAQNPVFWKTWQKKSLKQAQNENKLIIISIGYATCHWCHVMEHESFENEEVATLMNQYFVSIKIDREQRPDLDAVYMKAVQLMTNSGGWPLNVVCLPNQKPIWGGTYFSKENWMIALSQLAKLHQENPEKLFEHALKIENGLQKMTLIPELNVGGEFQLSFLEPLLDKWNKSFDHDFGGYARAPKFMMPNNLQFLMRFAFTKKNEKLLDYVFLTLDKMALGGIFDTLAGGFSRYSVDMKWHVPHFEKMLYDNSQMVSLYSKSYLLTSKILYKNIIEKTLCFITKEMYYEKGYFYTAFDADSFNENGKFEEGAFYTWTSERLQELLGKDFEMFSRVYSINNFGYWEYNQYVLIQEFEDEILAQKLDINLEELIKNKEKWESILYFEREKRSKPLLDTKVLCSWNALMSIGFLDAYLALGEEKYLEIATQNTQFILNNLWSSDGFLIRNFMDKHQTKGFLDDYAFVIQLLIKMYSVTMNENYIKTSKQILDFAFDQFFDEKNRYFKYQSNQETQLITDHFEIEDNVIPSSNSIMAENLFYLGVIFENKYYTKISQDMTISVVSSIDYPSAFSQWLQVYMNFCEEQTIVAVCGNKSTQEILKKYLPNHFVFGSKIASNLPYLKEKFSNETPFYVCKGKTCFEPSAIFNENNI